MLFNSYSYEILYGQFHLIYLQGDIKLLLVTVNNKLKFEIEIVHDLSCHPIYVSYDSRTRHISKATTDTLVLTAQAKQKSEGLSVGIFSLPN